MLSVFRGATRRALSPDEQRGSAAERPIKRSFFACMNPSQNSTPATACQTEWPRHGRRPGTCSKQPWCTGSVHPRPRRASTPPRGAVRRRSRRETIPSTQPASLLFKKRSQYQRPTPLVFFNMPMYTSRSNVLGDVGRTSCLSPLGLAKSSGHASSPSPSATHAPLACVRPRPCAWR